VEHRSNSFTFCRLKEAFYSVTRRKRSIAVPHNRADCSATALLALPADQHFSQGFFAGPTNRELPSHQRGVPASLMTITPTKHSLRLSQHGVVISELRTSPGPTHQHSCA